MRDTMQNGSIILHERRNATQRRAVSCGEIVCMDGVASSMSLAVVRCRSRSRMPLAPSAEAERVSTDGSTLVLGSRRLHELAHLVIEGVLLRRRGLLHDAIQPRLGGGGLSLRHVLEPSFLNSLSSGALSMKSTRLPRNHLLGAAAGSRVGSSLDMDSAFCHSSSTFLSMSADTSEPR